jgi:hypothetical protein
VTGRRLLAVGAAIVGLALAGCGPTQVQREFQKPTCVHNFEDANDAVPLMAQAVPTARLLPCIAQFPAGWSFDSSDVERGRARFWMDSDRAGLRALEVTLTRSCRPTGTPAPSDEPGALLFVHLDSIGPRIQGTRYYVVPGGCVTYQFDFPADGASVLSTDASTAIGMQRRSVIEQLAADLGYKVWIPPSPRSHR